MPTKKAAKAAAAVSLNTTALQFQGNNLAETVFALPCPQKILMVTDGSLNFGPAGFGLSEFVGIVKNAGHTVSTAHRNGVGPNLTIPGNYNFNTAAVPVTKANYDQIWLFGFNTTPLTPAEQGRIAQFMQSGGGLFATGDHETIGAGMGANLPRVRRMRNWASIPMVDPNRHDTVLEPGPDLVKQFNDQADAIPQRIFPVFFSNGGPDTVASTWNVAAILRHPSGAVDYLPDHPHESECLAPAPVAGTFAGVEEWPTPTVGGARIPPLVVAISVSAGRFITSGAPTPSGTKPPVRPRCFGAISAYNGDLATVGRIVCDATWHHFVNINLNGSGAGIDPATNLPRTGLYKNGVPTPEYLKIQRYYLNTVRWLAPIGRRTCWPFLQLAAVRFDYEVLELQLPHPHPCPWDLLIRIGTVVEDALIGHWGRGEADDIIDELLAATDAASPLTRLPKAREFALTDERVARSEANLLPHADLRRAVLGSTVNLIAHNLPEDEAKVASLVRNHDKLAPKLISEGVRGAEPAILDFLERGLKQANNLTKTIKAVQTEKKQ